MIHALGAMALNVITANTLQTPKGVLSVHLTEPERIEQQMRALLQAYSVGAIKIGMLGNAATVLAVSRALAAHPDPFVVLDPVVRSSGGAVLLDPGGVDALNHRLMPHVNLLTPNLDEQRVVLPAAGTTVLLKGGHAPGALCKDVLILPDGREEVFTEPRIQTPNSRGTGCVLSAGIAAGIAQGRSLIDAYLQSRQRLNASLHANAAQQFIGPGPSFV